MTPGVDPGLCAVCAHVEIVRSDRGSTFFRCGLAGVDPRFPKYPVLPVVQCRGWKASPDRADPTG